MLADLELFVAMEEENRVSGRVSGWLGCKKNIWFLFVSGGLVSGGLW